MKPRTTKKHTTTATKPRQQIHIILPDCHARKHDNDISRADLFKKLVADVKPTKILALGDVGEFDSISSFDADKPALLAGKDLKGDVDITLEFLERSLGAKSASSNCFRQFHLGNHEQRLQRVAAQHPELAGMLDVEQTLQLSRYFHHFVDYDGNVPGISLVDGVLYAHFHIAGSFAKPISGLHSAHSMLQKSCGVSMVAGHSHLLDLKIATQRGSGKKKFGLVAGCFIEPHAKFNYCGSAAKDWWSGVTILRGVEDGSFSEIRFVSLEELRRIYG